METTPNASLIVIGVKVVDRIGETVGSGRRETLLLTPVEIDNILYSFGPVGPVLIRPASRSPHQRKTQLTILRALHSDSANLPMTQSKSGDQVVGSDCLQSDSITLHCLQSN